MGFIALITVMVLCARSQDSVLSVSVGRVHVVSRLLLDLGAEERRVIRHVKLSRCGEASRKPRSLRLVGTDIYL